MKILLSPITFIISSFLLNVEASIWQPSQGDTWNIALGQKMDINKEKAKIVEIDYENKKDIINEYHKIGKKVICYFSGGTIEKWRGDYNDFKKVDGLVKNEYTGWKGEWWLDYRVEGIKPLLKARIKSAIDEGCDAIDIDNIDGYQVSDVKNKWTDPLTKNDAIKFTSWLGQTAHDLGISIGLKNGLDIIDTVGKYYNFAINEGCIKRNECYWYKNFLATGKPVFGITYGGLSDSNINGLCKNLENLPISMIIKESTELVQDYTVFDGKKYCGSDFKSGKVSSSSNTDDTKKAVTTETSSKKTTTTEASSKKTTTTEASSKKTTTTEASSKKTTTTEASSKKTTTTEASSKKTTTTEANSKKTTTTEASSKKTTTTEASSKKTTTTEASSKKTTTTESSPKKATTTESSPKKTTTSTITTTKKITVVHKQVTTINSKPTQTSQSTQSTKPIQSESPSQDSSIKNDSILMGNNTASYSTEPKVNNVDTSNDIPDDAPVEKPDDKSVDTQVNAPDNASGNAVVNAPGNASGNAPGNAPIVIPVKGSNVIEGGEKEESSKTIIGVAVTGSVVGAAALLILIKKNSQPYKNIKRGFSNRANYIRRSFSRN